MTRNTISNYNQKYDLVNKNPECILKEDKLNTNKQDVQFVDEKINVKIVLAALWSAHFLLWTFGDMASLLQKMNEPVDDSLLLLVAVPLALIQALMIFFSLVGKAKWMRWANIVVTFIFALFNVGFMVDAHVGWEYLLGAGYLLMNGLIIWQAWNWPKE
jgi:hypothetical protein